VPVAFCLLRTSPAESDLVPDGKGEVAEVTGTDAEPIIKSGIGFRAARKSLAFILLGIFFFILTAVARFVQHIPTYLINQGYNTAFSGNIMSATMIGLFIGSLLFGFLTDKIGSKKHGITCYGIRYNWNTFINYISKCCCYACYCSYDVCVHYVYYRHHWTSNDFCSFRWT